MTYVDGHPAMQIAGELYRRGESQQRMVDATGLRHGTIRRLALGEAPRLWPSTAKAAEKLWDLLPKDAA